MRCAIARAATRRGCSRMTGAVVDERGRHARGLAGARLRGDDDGARSARGVDNLVDEGVDRKRIAPHADVASPTGQLTPVPPRPQ